MIETLYFSCYHSFLLGDQQKTRIYYELLKEEFKLNGTPSSLKQPYLIELKKIKHALETGASAFNTWADDDKYLEGPSAPQTPAGFSQDYLVRHINTNVQQLSALLKDNLTLYNIEHPCDPYGAVDMVFMGEKTVYPVEVKKDQGRHDLIGQIYKYDLYHKLRLRYKFYERVQSVTICQSYEPYTLKSLKQAGIKTFLYTLNEEVLNLTSL